jgi:NADPH-dependent 2,4-dienoyl-CoA reductase/sulfur reductase-like enzyme
LTSERVAIVGAGPAGRAASALLDQAGVLHDVLDEQPRSGGNIERRRFGASESPFDVQATTRFRGCCTVLGLRAGGLVHLHEHDEARVEAFAAVLSTAGAYDLMLPRPGWPGSPSVSTAGALQALLKGEGILPRGRVVIAGSGPFLHIVAADLIRAGAQVTHVIDRLTLLDYVALSRWAPGPRGAAILAAAVAAAAWARARQLFGRAVDSIREGHIHLSGGEVVPFDHLGLSDRFAAQTQLARTAGVRTIVRPYGAYVAVDASAEGRTSVPGLYVAGEAVAVRGAEHARASGALAALAILEDLGRQPPPVDRVALDRRRRRHARFGDALERAVAVAEGPAPLGQDAAVLCTCEEVRVGAVREALRDGLQDLSSIKTVTRCGMGVCQGRLCEPLLLLAFREMGVTPRGVLSQKALVRPLSAEVMARE